MNQTHVLAVTCEKGSHAFRWVLGHLLSMDNGHTVNGYKMKSEILGCHLEVKDGESLDFDLDGRAPNRVYKIAEALWDLGPSDNMDILRAFNPEIMRFVEDQPEPSRDYAVWAYGPHIHAEIMRVVKELRKDKFSRRAVISIPRTLRIMGTPPCLISLQFIIRNSLLHCIANMRSNDIWFGLQLDMFQFNLVQRIVAASLQIPVGTYQHISNSMHLYERDVEVATKVYDTKGAADTCWTSPPFSIHAATLVRNLSLYNALRMVARGDVPDRNLGSAFDWYLKTLMQWKDRQLGFAIGQT